MIPTALQYIDFLKLKLSILYKIQKNTAEQSEALEKKDHGLLGKLLEDRQGYIEQLGQLMRSQVDDAGVEKTEELIKWEQAGNYLIKDIIRINRANVEKAGDEKNELASAIRNINIGRNAIHNGYFKRMPQRFGYFIDQKVGKGPRSRGYLGQRKK